MNDVVIMNFMWLIDRRHCMDYKYSQIKLRTISNITDQVIETAMKGRLVANWALVRNQLSMDDKLQTRILKYENY